MHLTELVNQARCPAPAAPGVPDWMVGYFERRSITFANGQSDEETTVCWLQSRNLTIDLRLPRVQELVPLKPWHEYGAADLEKLADYEGWSADCTFDGRHLGWNGGASLQLHNRWSEAAELRRVGNSMIEFAPSGAYVEDWRLQASASGPLAGLRLIEERDLETGEVRHRGGALIVCGDHAGLVLGRPEALKDDGAPNGLRRRAVAAQGNAAELRRLFAFETSVAHGSPGRGYQVDFSTRPERPGSLLFPLDGFSIEGERVHHRFVSEGATIERVFSVDLLEKRVPFEQATPSTPEAQGWFEQEAQTLGRYTRAIF